MKTLSFNKGEIIEKGSDVFNLLGGKTEYYCWVYPLQCWDEYHNSSVLALKVMQSFEIVVYENFFVIGGKQ